MELLFIEWRDAFDHDEVGWLSKEDMQEILEQEAVVESVGWLYDENDRYITIVGDYEGETVSRPTRIPVKWITQRITLTPILGRK
jgi:hypothetical protein